MMSSSRTAVYALLVGGGGETAGNPDTPNGVYRITAVLPRSWWPCLGAWFTANPTEFIAPDYNPEGSLFDLRSDGEKLWVSEAVGGRLVTVTPEGDIALVADLSVDHLVPTGVALDGEGGAYVTFRPLCPTRTAPRSFPSPSSGTVTVLSGPA